MPVQDKQLRFRGIMFFQQARTAKRRFWILDSGFWILDFSANLLASDSAWIIPGRKICGERNRQIQNR